MKRIFLVDDHPLLREGLHQLIDRMPDCEVCGEAATAEEAADAIAAATPDLVMLDITLPDQSGLDFLKDLKVNFPQIPVLVFSMHDEMLYAVRALRAGAKGYLMKGTSSEILKSAIRRVLLGERYLSARVCENFVGSLVGKGRPKFGPQALSCRELEVFESIGAGLGSVQIGEKLDISPKTVDAHRANIRVKLSMPDSQSVNRAAVMWVEIGKD